MNDSQHKLQSIYGSKKVFLSATIMTLAYIDQGQSLHAVSRNQTDYERQLRSIMRMLYLVTSHFGNSTM